MSKRNLARRAAVRQAKPRHPDRQMPASSLDQIAAAVLNGHALPRWAADEGNLYWQGVVILHLAKHAHAERAILDAFDDKWTPVIVDPIPRDTIGDPTQSRRNAIANLNRHLGKEPPIKFFTTSDGMVGWRPRR